MSEKGVRNFLIIKKSYNKTMKKKNKFKLITGPNENEFFDDCPVCRAIKAAKEKGKEPTLEELKEAFQKAKDNGAVVGGEWFK